MANYISNYRVKLELSNAHLVGCLIGEGGKKRREIAAKTGTTVTISQNSLEVEGSFYAVREAENRILDIISEHSFQVHLTNQQAGRILGPGGQDLKDIRLESRASIGIAPQSPGGSRKLEIIGRTKEMRLAKEKILDKLEVKLRQEVGNYFPNNCFRKFQISKGTQLAHFAPHQLPPNPHMFFLNFKNTLLLHEQHYICEPVDKSIKKPPRISEKCGILAPYQGSYFRAEVLKVVRSDDKIGLYLLVKFVDFGNISLVDYFLCRHLEAKYLFPPQAVACSLSNIKNDGAWKNEAIDLFRQYVNEFTLDISVKVRDSVQSDALVLVELMAGKIEISTLLVNSSVASWADDPLEPSSPPPRTRFGSVDALFVTEGWAGVAIIDVTSTNSTGQLDEWGFTYTSNFETESVLNSIKTAYVFCKKYLEERENTFLDTHKLHFSVENLDFIPYKYFGPSMGTSFVICILSECLQLEIPSDVALTGQVSGHGEVFKVGDIREKIVAALKNGKWCIYVPLDNIIESVELNIDGIEVKTMKDIYTVIFDLWNM